MELNQIEVVQLPEKHYVGLSVTSSFRGHDPKRVEQMKESFFCRYDEIRHVVDETQYVSPHFSSEQLFTYLICAEVSRLSDIPEGMIGFTIPAQSYVKTRSSGDPYAELHQYVKEHNLSNNSKALALEVYKRDMPVWPNETEVYIPLARG
ncbi:effector binding domain-containing protein [Paenibacillus sp. NEAU-GSW1]|uniref:GyrI-like domain-containing protein n=1 Tax=Paenibacillus sp. NEAU-GSW1 TaxID=2682486 RepID=UPI0015632949